MALVSFLLKIWILYEFYLYDYPHQGLQSYFDNWLLSFLACISKCPNVREVLEVFLKLFDFCPIEFCMRFIIMDFHVQDYNHILIDCALSFLVCNSKSDKNFRGFIQSL